MQISILAIWQCRSAVENWHQRVVRVLHFSQFLANCFQWMHLDKGLLVRLVYVSGLSLFSSFFPLFLLHFVSVFCFFFTDYHSLAVFGLAYQEYQKSKVRLYEIVQVTRVSFPFPLMISLPVVDSAGECSSSCLPPPHPPSPGQQFWCFCIAAVNKSSLKEVWNMQRKVVKKWSVGQIWTFIPGENARLCSFVVPLITWNLNTHVPAQFETVSVVSTLLPKIIATVGIYVIIGSYGSSLFWKPRTVNHCYCRK